MAGALVCRHNDGGAAVSADQYGEQTYIKQGKAQGGLKGLSTRKEQVAVWVHSHAISTHLSEAIELMFIHHD